MILTPVTPDRLRRTLIRFGSGLESSTARRIFHRLASPAQSKRARGAAAKAHRLLALHLARRLGLGLRPGMPRAGLSWDGHALASRTEAYVLLHEIAHYQLAAPRHRRDFDFALGPGPETGRRAAAEQARRLPMREREDEEALASLLGILWESACHQPALASFLDQNWLEGANRRGAARYFETLLAALRRGGFIDAAGRPRPRWRRTGELSPLANAGSVSGAAPDRSPRGYEQRDSAGRASAAAY